MKPKNRKASGGVFTTDEGLNISIPPKNIIEKEVLRKELLKMQEGFFMEIETSPHYVYLDEKGKVIKRTTTDGKVLTGKQSEKEETER